MQSTIAICRLRLRALGLLAFLLLAGRGLAGEGLVYAVTRAGAPPSYLVGTMHSEDPRVVALLDRIGPLIRQVDVVAIELLPDAVTMFAVGAATLLPFDQSLRGVIGDARFEALEAAAAEVGISGELLNRLKPWAAAVTLGMPAAKSGRFLDMEIYLYALEHGRRALGLESAAEQLAVFDGMTPGQQLSLLDEMVKNAAHMPTQLEELTQAYLAGDLDRLDSVARGQYGHMSPEVTEWLERTLLDERNARMVERLSGLLKSESVLVAVGALHLGGRSGLIDGLRRLGYRVEPWPG